MNLTIVRVDYAVDSHALAVLRLLGGYAECALPAGLIGALARWPGAFSLLAQADAEFIGLANCFEGFSTFQARKLINIHDVFVDPAWRGQGVAARLLAEVEQIAVERGCCAITLEVLEGNRAAQAAYRRAGFGGDYRFWKKTLP